MESQELLSINPYTNNADGSSRTRSQDLYMLIHEIGHCLGFRHTDWGVEGPGKENGVIIGANPINGTPSQGSIFDDPLSIMNSGRLGTNNSWSRFSDFDIIASQNLYPILSNSTFRNFIQGESTTQVGSVLISTAGAGGYNSYEWRLLDINGNLVKNNPGGSDAQQIEWSYSYPGTYFLECRVIGAECPGEWFRQTVTFY